jgi:hypothetical protein
MNEYIQNICFIAYPWKSRNAERMMQEVIYPVLNEKNWEMVDPRYFQFGISIYDAIVKYIKFSNLFICDVTYSNPSVIYELGLAHAWGTPTIVLAENIESIPFDIASKYQILLYSKDIEQLRIIKENFYKLLSSFEERTPSLLPPSYKRYIDLNRTISIEIFTNPSSAIEALQYTYKTLECLGRIEILKERSLDDVRIGSFGAWVSANIETIANLIEKIIFIVPEWKKKNAECLRIEAESKLLLAQAEKESAEAEAIRKNIDRENADKLFELMQRGKSLGPARLTIGNKIRIESDEEGRVLIGPPIDEKDKDRTTIS